jgi:glycosyltransferase involved in cell wall biosynthesis
VADTLPITAIVASHDEAHLLPACLEALAFCDELIVVDIASSDDTRAVAERHGARVIESEWVPIAERARARPVAEARHDWLLIRDPDEVIPAELEHQLRALLPTLGDDVAVVTAPTQRYFAGRPLRGTAWGGVQKDRLLANRRLVEFPTAVHRRLIRKEGARDAEIPPDGDNAIRHYWVDGYGTFVRRHLRYMRLEGTDRAEGGEITGPRAIAATPLRSFRDSFFRDRGWRDGPRGLALSLLYALYKTGAELMLLREVRRRGA